MGFLFGFKTPKYAALGGDLAGEVVSVGPGVQRFQVGDRVVANLGMKLGGHAQYKALSENLPIAKVPPEVSWESAAALVFGGSTALVFLRDKLKIKSGDRLLVIGAGGAVGSAAVQVGRALGAVVTAVCGGDKAALVSGLGASRVIDYRKTNWREGTGPFEAILDTVGDVTFENSRQLLTPAGKIGLVVADLPATLKSAWISATHSQKVIAGPISESRADLEFLVSLCLQGRFRPLIGHTLPFERIVEAHRIVESGHKTGNVVLTL